MYVMDVESYYKERSEEQRPPTKVTTLSIYAPTKLALVAASASPQQSTTTEAQCERGQPSPALAQIFTESGTDMLHWAVQTFGLIQRAQR